MKYDYIIPYQASRVNCHQDGKSAGRATTRRAQQQVQADHLAYLPLVNDYWGTGRNTPSQGVVGEYQSTQMHNEVVLIAMKPSTVPIHYGIHAVKKPDYWSPTPNHSDPAMTPKSEKTALKPTYYSSTG